MIEYETNLPLIIIHLPKTAGVSVKEIYRAWFSDGLLFHYFEEGKRGMPTKYDLVGMHSKERPIALYGHFNKRRGFGVEQYYPDAKQFITILRDPFERAISGYYFLRNYGKNWKDQSRIPKNDIREYLLNFKGSMTNQFPCETTLDNYKEVIESLFIEVGITEFLDESMTRIAQKLSKEYKPGSLPHLNATERDQSTPYDLKEAFMEKNQLDYAIYNYVLSKYAQQNHPAGQELPPIK